MMRLVLVIFVGCLTCRVAFPADPVLRVVHDPLATSLLRNGGFEDMPSDRLAGWQSAPKGFELAVNEGRNRSRAIRCENTTGNGWFGASQTITLNRTNAAPLTVRGWSKALDVAGGSDSNYSIYVDLIYADGTPLWGQSASFRAGTHDWQQREFTIFPEKPVKTATVHCLFRGHAGTVWFDDVALAESSADGKVVMFQGVAVTPAPVSQRSSRHAIQRVETPDGLRLVLEDQTVNSLEVADQILSADGMGGFLVRDVAAGSDFFRFDDGACAALSLKLDAEIVARSNHIVVQGRLSDTSKKDRAVTLVFGIPIDAGGWSWGDDIRRSRTISSTGEFVNQVSIHGGATGTTSLYPVAPIWDRRTGLALALDMGRPAVFRTGYHAGLKSLFIAYDFGLVQETERFPNAADFRFVLYRFDPSEGFRSAWQKYTEIFPDYFVVRSKEQGLWMPFTDVSRVKGWPDFGFRYHEGNNNVPWDDDHGILSFRYTEPMTWWMPMKKEIPRTLAEARRVRDEYAQGGDGSRRRLAEVTRVAAMHDDAGDPALQFRNEPWANGAVWSLNPNPWLGAGSTGSTAAVNAATVHWNDSIKERLYGPNARGRLDGEYLDSLEGYVTTELNFRRSHFATTTVPLTFSAEAKRPALFKGLAVFEFTRWIAQDVRRLDKLMFANGVPYRFAYLCPWLDVLGTETDWLRAGKYQPVPLATTDLWRTLSGGKPYLLLMNTDYDKFTPELVEKYFQRALFYGMWPGFFSHNAAENPYWQNPRWYERDRPLFQKYIPLIKRVAEAGWQPVTHARCDNEEILVERFGPAADGAVYLTLFNKSPVTQSGNVRMDLAAPERPRTVSPKPLFGDAPGHSDSGWHLMLLPHQATVWQLSRDAD